MVETEWLKALAKADQHRMYGRFASRDRHGASALIHQATESFANECLKWCQNYVTMFNRFQTDEGCRIKIFDVERARYAQFLLHRNSCKLSARVETGEVRLVFEGARQAMAQRSTTLAQASAVIAPFDEVIWRDQEHRVSVETILKGAFTSFIRKSVRGNK